MNLKNIVLGIFTVVTMLLISSSSLFAQNLIVNGDFEQTSGFNYNVISDYIRITAGAVESGHFIHDVTSTGHGSGDLGGWPTNLTGYGGSGYYLLFNGFGNSENPTKVAWRQTVNVTSHTTYTFSCQLRNLSQSFFGFNANTAIIRIKINGNTAGQDVTFSISNHDWQEVTRTWNSGNVSGPITIEIFDVFTGAPNSGDDFGLDHISFTPTTVYSVDAIDDPDISVCLDQFVYVDVLVNDVVAPEPSDADVSIVEDPSWGDAEVLPDKRIRYKYTGGGNGTDQIKYQVTNHYALDEAWVYINTSSPPFVGNIDNPDPICAGNSFNLTIPTIQNNGSTIINQGWQIAASQNGSYSDFNNDNVPYTYNNYWIRYYAINNCDTTYCESIEVTVNDSPIVGAITAPEGICEGEAFSLTTPSVTWRHNDLSTCSGSWEIQINGVWGPLINQNIPFEYNGCLIRYKAVNGCDTTYSPNNAQITVYSSAPINEGEIMACDPIYYHGQYCDTTGLYIVNDITPNGCAIQVSWHFTLGEAYIAPVQYVDTCDFYYWPKTLRTYYESNVYDTIIYSDDPQVCDSTFILDLTINHAPAVQEDIQMNDICLGDLLAVSEPEFEYNHSGGGRRQWEYATSADGPFHAFDPETYHLGYGNYFIRFAVINECDSTFSNVVAVHVNDQPVISGQLSSLQACEGNPLDLPEVTVDWRNVSQSGVSGWQMADHSDGPYAQFDLNTTMQMGHNGHWIRYMACNECDTVFLGPVQVTVLDEQDVTIEHGPECDTVMFNGVYYTESTTVDEMVDLPCPHVVHHEILVNHSDFKEIERTTCQEYFDWHGHHFEHSDETQYATFDTINRFGCDSTVVLKLDFGPYEKIDLDDVVACDSCVWDMNPDVVYYESQRDSVFVPASSPNDCPTWYCLNMNIGKSYNEVEGDPLTQCYGFEWHGVSYYEDDVVYDSLLTKFTHCDSIVFHSLTIIQPMDTIVDMVSCEPYLWHTHLFSEDETFTDTLQSVVTGCDSIVTINFRLDDIVNEFDTVACEPFVWYGNVCDYSHPDMTIQHVFQFPMRCDSTVVKHVRLEQASVQEKPKYACTPYLCSINGVLYEEPGVFYVDSAVVSSQNDCDSIVYTVRLEIKDSEHIGLISGASNVFVASNLINGIYRYEINAGEVMGNITWHLSNPNWQIVEANQNYCLVFVTTPGTATLSGSFMTPECGIIERSLEINAGFFGVDNHEAVTAKVYPNPTNSQVTVESEGIESIHLTNMMGQVLEAKEYDRSDSVVLDLNGYSPSVYLLEIKTVYGITKKQLVLCR